MEVVFEVFSSRQHVERDGENVTEAQVRRGDAWTLAGRQSRQRRRRQQAPPIGRPIACENLTGT
jgi:hypothetical protein